MAGRDAQCWRVSLTEKDLLRVSQAAVKFSEADFFWLRCIDVSYSLGALHFGKLTQWWIEFKKSFGHNKSLEGSFDIFDLKAFKNPPNLARTLLTMEGFWWSLDANEISGTWSASRLDGAVLEKLIEPKMTGEPPLVPWWNQGFRWQVSCFSWAVGRFGPDMQTAAGKPWNLCSFARMKRHTLTTLSGMSWGQQVHTGMSTYSTRPQEQGEAYVSFGCSYVMRWIWKGFSLSAEVQANMFWAARRARRTKRSLNAAWPQPGLLMIGKTVAWPLRILFPGFFCLPRRLQTGMAPKAWEQCFNGWIQSSCSFLFNFSGFTTFPRWQGERCGREVNGAHWWCNRWGPKNKVC